jgi:hypothetical protein
MTSSLFLSFQNLKREEQALVLWWMKDLLYRNLLMPEVIRQNTRDDPYQHGKY